MIRKAFLILGLVILVPILMSAGWVATTQPSIKDNETGTRVSLTIPGFVVRMGSLFIPADEPEIRQLLKKISGIKLLVAEGGYYESEAGSFDQKVQNLEKDGYERLLRVHSAEEHVQLAIRQDRKGNIRKLAIVVDDSESFVYARINCKLSLEELGKLMQNSEFEGLDVMKHNMGIQDELISENPTPELHPHIGSHSRLPSYQTFVF